MAKRYKTKYPGIFYIVGKTKDNKPEKIFYLRYRKDGKQIEEKVGRQFKNAMTESKANNILTDKIRGKKLSNSQIREQKRAKEKESNSQWTIVRLWEEYQANNNPKRIDVDISRYNKHIGPALGDAEPKNLVKLDITRFRRNLEKKRLKPGSVSRILEVLRRIINFGVNEELIAPVKYKVDLPQVHNEKTEFLTNEQFTRLWQVLEADHDKQAANLMKMVILTGMRAGELFKLKWEDIDFEHGAHGFIKIVDPKGKKTQKIPLNSMAKDLLMNHPKIYPDSPYVFPGKSGDQRKYIRKPVNRIKKDAGLPCDFRPLHGLRHTFATMLASSGKVDIYTLQKLMTHKDPRMTQRYAHLVDNALIRASEVAGDIVGELVNG